jgi:hypothetical protein
MVATWLFPIFALLSGMAMGSILSFVYLRRNGLPSSEVEDAEGRMSLTRGREMYLDEPESLYGHEARGKTSEFEAAALDATLA